ncbi:transcriptional regulator [Sporosarcina sp. P18a]|uniref:helix-turn-helix domain-containing protein n=1 Tax=Sporosarcina sp. P18a TaxID=2048259 RepID=UPI000C1641C4|nr:helix-turn-helix transcriptional regulator [Sporosarcina sp. P18a]PIC79402.1 transcriptional regulator [Sporosarcina sp. P18a]
MSFQLRLKMLRLNKGLTQEDMAAMLGITRQAYGYYESTNNQRETDHKTTRKLANFFNVSIDYLLENTNNPSDSKIVNSTHCPDLNTWISDLYNHNEKDLIKLKKIWDIIKDNN